MTDTVKRAKEALYNRYRKLNPDIDIDPKGYIKDSQENLLQSEWLQFIKGDYDEGGGKELNWKFHAIHSSAALVANHFARFKKEPGQLIILGRSGFGIPIFEKQLPTGLQGIPPNLDVFLENLDCCIAIESKLLETLSPKKPHFSLSYSKVRLPHCEPQWLDIIESDRGASEGYLDTAQLVKHYLGLVYHVMKHKINKKSILLYLYWKPVNATEIGEYQKHDREVEQFKNKVAGSCVEFIPLSYPELWETWCKESGLADHGRKLMDRYSVKI